MPHLLYTILSLLALTALLISAGCIDEKSILPAVETTPVTPSADLQAGLTELADDLVLLERTVLLDLTALANQMKTAEDDSKREQLARDYYAQDPWLVSIGYHNLINDTYWVVPVAPAINLSSYAVSPTEEDFQKNDGFIIRNSQFYQDHGYVNFYYRPVYDADDTYCGCLVFVIDTHAILNYHPFLFGQKKSYDDYVCFITDASDRIIYSSIQEAIGMKIPKGEGYYDGMIYLPDVQTDAGACRYTSSSFYDYGEVNRTEKVTAWQSVYSSKSGATIMYLIEEPGHKRPETVNAYHVDPEFALTEARDAYMFARMEGKLDLSFRINDGYYTSPMCIMDMKGTVISSADPAVRGKNYLNNLGAYGYSYVLAAILTAEQGGGFIYYTLPNERTVDTKTAQYCIGIITPLDGTCFIFTRFTASPDVVLKDYDVRTDVKKVSRAILQEISRSGIDAVADTINAHAKRGADFFVSNLSTDIAEVSIVDMYGNIYASLLHPEMVGESSTGQTDVYGGSTARRAIMLAKTGSGFTVDLTPNPEREGYVDLWLLSIEPIDDMYYICAGAVIGTFEDVLKPYMKMV
ncbi:MAG: cache domain-containing protein [Methanocorpusculum sp.]|nr:cache domain-containing protein [Methanocorpusculum sp.]